MFCCGFSVHDVSVSHCHCYTLIEVEGRLSLYLILQYNLLRAMPCFGQVCWIKNPKQKMAGRIMKHFQ